MSRIARCILIAGMFVLLPGPYKADVFQVTKAADTNDGVCDQDCSLREAIEAANANVGADAVPVPAGTYLLTLGQLTVADDVSIAGAGQAATIIDGNAANRVIEISGSGVFEISGVTIQNGRTNCCTDPDGAGIALAVGSLTLTDSTVSGNTSDFNGYGGGISNRLGHLAIANSTVSGNTSLEYGGGIWSVDGSVTVTDTAIHGNSAIGAGGIFVYRGSLDMTNSTVVGNTVVYSGGGIMNYNGLVTISNSTVSNNTANTHFGGGIFTYAGTLYLDGSTVANNSSSVAGGGIYSDTGPLVILNSTISGNTTGSEGGGIFAHGESVTIMNSTVTDNLASDYGSGISSLGPGTLYLANVIVAGNHAFAAGPNCDSRDTISLGYNLSDDASCELTAPGDLVVADAMLGSLTDNGGPTETHELLAGSPAIDAGSPDCPPPATDQRGVVRPQGAGCDIGAFESGMASVIVEVDIKPGSDRNRINPFSRGVIPVVILGSEDFDATDIDLTRLTFGIGGALPAIVGRRHRDQNGDGFPDLLSRFRIIEAGIEIGDTEVCLRGETLDGIPFGGCDTIRTVPDR